MTGGVYVNVLRLRREIALRGWRQTDLARAAGLSAGTITTVMKGGPVSPATLRKVAATLRRHPIIPGMDELLHVEGAAA
jgi:transcriptional regulator with XRE-family HTH domain